MTMKNVPSRDKRNLGDIEACAIQMPGETRWRPDWISEQSVIIGNPLEAIGRLGPATGEAGMAASAVMLQTPVYRARDFGWEDREFDTADEVFDFIKRELPQAMRLIAS